MAQDNLKMQILMATVMKILDEVQEFLEVMGLQHRLPNSLGGIDEKSNPVFLTVDKFYKMFCKK